MSDWISVSEAFYPKEKRRFLRKEAIEEVNEIKSYLKGSSVTITLKNGEKIKVNDTYDDVLKELNSSNSTNEETSDNKIGFL